MFEFIQEYFKDRILPGNKLKENVLRHFNIEEND